MFPLNEQIIGEIPADDLNLLEENYQKALYKCLEGRGMNKPDYEGKLIRLMPAKYGGIYHVVVSDPPFKKRLPPESEPPYTS